MQSKYLERSKYGIVGGLLEGVVVSRRVVLLLIAK